MSYRIAIKGLGEPASPPCFAQDLRDDHNA